MPRTKDPLVAFVYTLLHDHLPVGVINKIIERQAATVYFELEDPLCARKAETVAAALTIEEPNGYAPPKLPESSEEKKSWFPWRR